MNIYIGNLNYRVRESDLQQVLEEYGTVESVKLIIDRDTRRSKGFAFAELPNENEARNAIEELNGAEYEGRQMVVKEATPRQSIRTGIWARFYIPVLRLFLFNCYVCT